MYKLYDMEKKTQEIIEKALFHFYDTHVDEQQDILLACKVLPVSAEFRDMLQKKFDDELDMVVMANAESLARTYNPLIDVFEGFGRSYRGE